MVRVWVESEDMGTMTEQASRMFLEVQHKYFPEEATRVETVEDDAPVFLLPMLCGHHEEF